MILTYSLPRFKDLILSGEKIHTIREDKTERWKPGRSIQHWLYSPRNISKNPHCFLEGICEAVQEVEILRFDGNATGFLITVDGKPSHFDWLFEIPKNDGLTIAEFREWFVPESSPHFFGRIIHFTDKMY